MDADFNKKCGISQARAAAADARQARDVGSDTDEDMKTRKPSQPPNNNNICW